MTTGVRLRSDGLAGVEILKVVGVRKNLRTVAFERLQAVMEWRRVVEVIVVELCHDGTDSR